jgi:serine/threonine-protein kinase RsbW
MGALLVAPEPSSAAVARHAVVADLTARGLPVDALGEVALVTSELVGNAIRHGAPLPSGQLRVEWAAARGEVVVRVTDGSGGRPRLRSASVDDIHGRGLTIVDSVAREWGCDYGDERKTVWARLDIATADPTGRGRRKLAG